MLSTLKYKSPHFNKVILQSKRINLKVDQRGKYNGYFDVQGNLCRFEFDGVWFHLIGTEAISEGIHHFSVKLTKSSKGRILTGYVSIEQVDGLNPIHSVKSYMAYYFMDGTTRSSIPAPNKKIKPNVGQVIHTVCDINNGLITWVHGQTNQILAQGTIPPEYRGKPMMPLMYFYDKDDTLQIINQ